MYCILITSRFSKIQKLYPVTYETEKDANDAINPQKGSKVHAIPYSKAFNTFQIKEII